MNENKKSFWERPEGFTGALIPVAILITGFFIWGEIVPYILSVVQDTVKLVWNLAILAVVTFVVVNPGTRNLAWFMYKALSRKITSIFVNTDPIGIMKSYLSHLRAKKEDIWNQIENLSKQKGILKHTIAQNKQVVQHQQSIANQAEKVGDTLEFKLAINEIGRTESSNTRLSDSLTMMESLSEQIENIHKNADYYIRNMEGEIRVRENEYKALEAVIKATRSAKSIIMGSDISKKLMYEESLIALSDDMGRKVGEIELFMKSSSSFISKMDLQNGIYDEAGYKALEEMNKNMYINNVGNNSINQTIDISPKPTQVSPNRSKYLS